MSVFQPQVTIVGLHSPNPRLGGEITRDGNLVFAAGYVKAAAVVSDSCPRSLVNTWSSVTRLRRFTITT